MISKEELKIISGRIVNIDKRENDRQIIWETGFSIDDLALKYYNNEAYYRVIMMANPKYSMAFDINKGDIIRIPFPLKEVIEEIDYKNKNYRNE